LVKLGEIQLLYDLLDSKEYPSFGYIRECGATTLWEYWSGKASHNHPMFGGCVKQLLYGLLGICADAGWKRVTVSPKYIEGIGFIRAKIQLAGGTVYFDYRYHGGAVYPRITTRGCRSLHLTLADGKA
jgi:alpha-L-rhamnosidase